MATTRRQIPPHAKCVFKGKLFDVWQWEQKMYDGSTKVFERLWRPNTTQAIAVVGEKILLQTEEQPDRPEPFRSLPGGRCDGDEDPLLAVRREFLEETGYVSDDWELWRERQPVGKIEWTIYTYIARNCKKVGEPQLDEGEKITNQLIAFDEFLALADDASFRERDLKLDLLRARYDPKAKAELHKLLFG